MKPKKIIMYIGIVLLILFILLVGIKIIKIKKIKNNKKNSEYIPVEEITEEQLRQTNINLYFYNSNTKEVVPEIRKIDSKNLLENPENKLIQFLINGPEDNSLSRLIPEGTELIGTKIDKGILLINFSDEFINNKNGGIDYEKKIIESILKTVLQLNEINGIKILINGETNGNFGDTEINFENIFTLENI